MALLVLLVVVALLAVLSLTRVRAALAFFVVVTGFYFAGLLPFEGFIGGFTEKNILTFVLLMLISSVISKTQLRTVLRRFNWNRKRRIGLLATVVALLSSFLSNLFVTSLFLQAFTNRKQLSQILIPISYMSIVANTTLIATSLNLVANGLVVAHGLPPLGMFDFAYIGVPLTLFGIGYVTLFTHWLLPEDRVVEEPEEARYFVEATVAPDSPLVGKSIRKNRMRNLESLFLSEIIRQDQLITPVRPDEVILAGDTLVFTGQIENIKELQAFKGLTVFDQSHAILSRNLVSVVLSHQSDLVGKTIKAANFRSEFDAAVVAINRGAEKLAGKLGTIALQAGDNLILSVGPDFTEDDALRQHFYLMSEVAVTDRFSMRQTVLIIGGFVAAVVCSGMGLCSTFNASLLLVMAYVGLGYLNLGRIARTLDLEFVVVAGSALGISATMVEQGTAKLVSDAVLSVFTGVGPYGVLVGLYVMTVLLSELISHVAAISFVLPIAFQLAESLGISPTPYIFGAIFAANATFLWPYGYHTHLIIFSAGGYKVSDFLRYGLGFTLVYAIIALLLLPVVFPFHS